MFKLSLADPPTSIRERGKAERRVRIVEAARDLLTEGGVEALSMRTLSTEAGVSVPTIYNLIGGRDDVLAAVLDQLGAVFEAEVATASGEPLGRCFAISDLLLGTICSRATLTRSIVAEGLTPMLTDSEAGLLPRYGLALLTALCDAAEAGDLDDDTEPVLVVEQMVSLTAVRIFRWATDDPVADPDATTLRAAVAHGIGLLLAGAATGTARDRLRVLVGEARAALLAGSDR